MAGLKMEEKTQCQSYAICGESGNEDVNKYEEWKAFLASLRDLAKKLQAIDAMKFMVTSEEVLQLKQFKKALKFVGLIKYYVMTNVCQYQRKLKLK